ncbi:MAG TPA: hypothetical protein ENJ90_08025 [Devosia sp.]|nr:hypothetical protein [Devosia sp.]
MRNINTVLAMIRWNGLFFGPQAGFCLEMAGGHGRTIMLSKVICFAKVIATLSSVTLQQWQALFVAERQVVIVNSR